MLAAPALLTQSGRPLGRCSHMADDHRTALYRQLHKRHTADEPQRIYAAERVLRLVYDKIKVGSVLDVGCGRGLWLAVAAELGATETVGIEGPWIETQTTYIDLDHILTRDLELGFNLNRLFDLVMSIEVGEHLSAAAADTFVTSLVRHGRFILFSAAIPFQPGTGHINCQFPDYWAGLFAKHGYQPLDFIRRAIWSDRGIHVWIRQNVFAFVSTEFMVKNAWARETAASSGPLSIVHPELFTAVIRGR
jgi:cyclopropane fatty-acyl-phospholipid synthase-like methyltransferase